MAGKIQKYYDVRSLVITLLCYIFLAYAQAPDTLWTRTYAGIGNESALGVVETDDGCYLVVGYTQSFGASSYDVFVMKIDANGDSLWLKTYGGDYNESGRRIIRTVDSCYVIIGHTYSYGFGPPNTCNVYIVKIDPDGDTLWTKAYGTEGYDAGMAIAEEIQSSSADRYLIAAGISEDDAYLIKMSESGDSLWARVYGESEDDRAHDICCVPSGYVFAGITEHYLVGYSDIWLVHVSPRGEFFWEEVYGTGWNDWVSNMMQTNDGGFIMAGSTGQVGGSTDAYVLCVDPLGVVDWTRTYGGSNHDGSYHISKTSDNCYIIAGYTFLSGGENYDIYLLKINEDGDTLWTSTFGDTIDELGRMVLETDDRGYIIVGEKEDDIYIVRTAPDTLACRESFSRHAVQDYLSAYPNPCYGILRLCYSLSEPSRVLISVYDVAGRKQTSFNYGFMAPGKYQETIDLPDLSPGLYFVKLCAGKYTATASMIIADP